MTMFLEDTDNIYVLVRWPDVQDYMDYDWFVEEAVLHPEISSAYFIPINRIHNTTKLFDNPFFTKESFNDNFDDI